ncbi:MAG: AraC family transcriptional regulator, partial [Bacteroidales bacterium]
YLTGFPNAKYFSTAFKKYYGVTPSKFIEDHVK